jgi:hypothetical protein
MSHTPGPWESTGVTVRRAVHETDRFGRAITTYPAFTVSTRWGSIEQRKADACLIAAAPEMLGALRGVESTYVFLDSLTSGIEPQHANTVAALARVRAAIAKAEGK